MNEYQIAFAGIPLIATASGALWWATERVLCVSDLHLGKSERIARRGGTLLPPYENRETLGRLQTDLDRYDPRVVVCLGDSFDDLRAADHLDAESTQTLVTLMAGRDWIWIEGNHDPGPMGFGGTHMRELSLPPLLFRHIAQPGADREVSGHYHPKKRITGRGRSVLRPCFLIDQKRVILPAYGAYTGGLDCETPVLADLVGPDAVAILVGKSVAAVPA
ncbi:ligase-associated DNA damage response endonuclease PdeM [Actibacterium sp. 188UL27-1]|uniref:ligase-associated DNA damage response endonuclease PdeM n=1 Tax=Actibacterium sp. 188UL27-1 TaxID=2786961 RepID=UPI0019589504|nr:ligase-associated DNA damage response endonuclease PdeM [Actibacterium sp. 188UL27-1]MBM7068221.1 ligase-associated DNA damage response endonuclease PdeM [Actibacterium sp. 188UL27-1]